jgi:hypothetical protein
MVRMWVPVRGRKLENVPHTLLRTPLIYKHSCSKKWPLFVHLYIEARPVGRASE